MNILSGSGERLGRLGGYATLAGNGIILGSVGAFGGIGGTAIICAIIAGFIFFFSSIGLPLALVLFSHVATLTQVDDMLLRYAKWGLVVLLTIWSILQLSLEQRLTKYQANPIEISALAYLGWGLACSLLAVAPMRSAGEVLRMMTLIPAYTLTRMLVRKPGHVMALLAAFGISVIVSALASFAEIFGSGVPRASGLYMNANMLGIFMSFAVPALYLGFYLSKNWLFRIYFAGCIAAGGLALLMSWSRAGYLSLAVTTIIFLVIRKNKRMLALLAGVAVVGAILFFSSPTGQLVISSSLRLKSGVTHRTLLWKHGFEAFASHPIFGVGYAAPKNDVVERIYWNDPVQHLLYREPDSSFAPHNIYLYAMMSAGVLGLLFLLTLFYQISRFMAIGWRTARSPDVRVACQIGLALMGGIVAHGFFETGGFFGHGSWATYFWVLIGVISAIQSGAMQRNSKGSNAEPAPAGSV